MQVRVPGKVMLSGEYLVLIGGTAVLVPVPRYMTLTSVDSADPSSDTPVVREALAEPIPELAELETDLPPLQVAVDRSQFMTTDADGVTHKLGLGGSAAEAVGVISMRFQRCGVDWKAIPETIFKYADNAHRRAQGGMGSGADVAAIAYRKPIRFRRVNDQAEVEVIEKPQPEFIPELALAWTGVSANTREFVPKFLAWIESEDGHQYRKSLIETSEGLARKWFVREFKKYRNYLDMHTFMLAGNLRDAGIKWMLPNQYDLYRWAAFAGGFAKPTGAGGGDMTLLIGDLSLEDRPELIIELDPFAEH
ncbi:hypothetical protein KQI52_09585 [bacterium]|nr:hypothetical protein [bacterium]